MQNFGKICHLKGANKIIQKQVKNEVTTNHEPKKNYVRRSTGDYTKLF